MHRLRKDFQSQLEPENAHGDDARGPVSALPDLRHPVQGPVDPELPPEERPRREHAASLSRTRLHGHCAELVSSQGFNLKSFDLSQLW